MAITLATLEKQVPELTVDVYGNGEFLIHYLPSRLSKPVLKNVQALANDEDWEKKADSNPTFLTDVIPEYGWTLGEPDPNDPTGLTPLKGPDGKDVIQPVTVENLSKLGFIIMRDMARAINKSYSEFMAQGNETSVPSEGQSSVTSPATSSGTLLLSPQTEPDADLGS